MTRQLPQRKGDASDDKGTIAHEDQAHKDHVNQQELGLALFIGFASSELFAYAGWGFEFACVVACIWFVVFAVKMGKKLSPPEEDGLDSMASLLTLAAQREAQRLSPPPYHDGEGRLTPDAPPTEVDDDLSDTKKLRTALQQLTESPHVGTFAADALRQLDASQQKASHAKRLLSASIPVPDRTLQEHVITRIEEAELAICRNSEAIAHLCALFGDDYALLASTLSSGSYRHDNIDDDLQMRRQRTYEDARTRIGEILDRSERLLMSLDRLALKGTDQAMSSSLRQSRHMLDDMRALIDESSMYW